VEQLLIFYEATVATCSVSRAGLLSHAKPFQARLSGDSAQVPTRVEANARLGSRTAVFIYYIQRFTNLDDQTPTSKDCG